MYHKQGLARSDRDEASGTRKKGRVGESDPFFLDETDFGTALWARRGMRTGRPPQNPEAGA